MPELPEVETVCRGLAPYLNQTQIQSIRLLRPNLRFPFAPDFCQRLHKQKTGTLQRRAKYLLLPLENNETLLTHLGMSGRFRIQNNPHPQPHDHVLFRLTQNIHIAFNDVRRFGFMEIWPEIQLCPRLQKLGPEPLSENFSPAFLDQKLKPCRTSLKSALLNQSIAAGIGNIYACETLFNAKLHPARKASSLTESETQQLTKSIKYILKIAIRAGGSSLRDHAQPDGSPGYFQQQLAVYGRENQHCTLCRSHIQRLSQAGRSTFFCPNCQFFTPP